MNNSEFHIIRRAVKQTVSRIDEDDYIYERPDEVGGVPFLCASCESSAYDPDQELNAYIRHEMEAV